MNDNILFKKRFRFIVIHLILSIICLIFTNGLHLHENFRFMYIYSIWTIFVYIRLLMLEIKYSSGLTLVLFYLIGCLMRVGIGGYSMAQKGLDNINIYYILNNVSDSIFPTSIWMNITYMLFLGVFTFLTKNMNTNIDLSDYVKKYDTLTISILLYITAYLFRLFPFFSFTSTINVLLGDLNKVALLLLMFTCVYKGNIANLSIFFLLIVLEIVIAIFTGFYKGGIVMPTLFLVMYVYLKDKWQNKSVYSLKMFSLISVIFVFLLLFVYPFMNEKRGRSGFDPFIGKATKEYSNIDIIEDVLSGKIQYEEGNSTSEQFISRMDAITTNAFFYKHVDQYGEYIYMFIYKSVEILIPRVLYPEKPLNDIGMMATSLANSGSLNTMHETYYTYIGLFSSMYMMGGGFAVLIMCILNGFIYARIYKYSLDNIINPFSLLLLFKILLGAYTAYEETTTAGISFWLEYAICIVMIFITNLLFRRNIKIKLPV